MSYKSDYSKATQAFLKNKDIIGSAFVGTLYSLEVETSQFNSLFDQIASTDLLYKVDDRLYGVAMRVNFAKSWHRHVTIRYTRQNGSKTEFEKTMCAMEQHAITARLGIQIDVDDDLQIINGIVYDRIALFEYIRDNLNQFKSSYMHTVKEDGNTMFFVTYEQFAKLKISSSVYNALESQWSPIG